MRAVRRGRSKSPRSPFPKGKTSRRRIGEVGELLLLPPLEKVKRRACEPEVRAAVIDQRLCLRAGRVEEDLPFTSLDTSLAPPAR